MMFNGKAVGARGQAL